MRLRKERRILDDGFSLEAERGAANATGRLAILGQVDALLAGEIDIGENDSEAEAMHRQDCEGDDGSD